MLPIDAIYQGDALIRLAEIDEDSVDLVITSPKYNLGVQYDSCLDYQTWPEYYEWCRVWMKEIYRVLKPDGRFCLNHYLSCGTAKARSNPLMNLNAICVDIGFKEHGLALWTESSTCKRTAWGSWVSASAPYLSSPHECISVFYKDHWKKDRKGESTITKEEFMNWTLGIWKMNPERSRGGCPAPFPEELPRRCIRLFSYKDDLVLDPFNGCFDDKTELLTKRGWVLFEMLQSDDKICSLNPDSNEIEWVSFTNRQKYWYDGEMYRIEGRSIDLLVTPNHKDYVKEYHKLKFGLEEVKTINYAQFHKLNQGNWKSEKEIDKTWLELLGFWYGDGYISPDLIGFRIGFNLQKDRKQKYLENLFSKLQWNYRVYDESKMAKNRKKYTVSDVTLKSWFDGNAHTKSIPKYIFDLSAGCIESFLKGLFEADGHGRYFYTCNKILADQVQILLLLSGGSGTVSTREGRDAGSSLISSGGPQYVVNSHKKGKKFKLYKENLNREPYSGFVYDVTLIRNHILYVRRNDKPCWSGNSGTTTAVAKREDRHYLGIDISEAYCNDAREWLETGIKPKRPVIKRMDRRKKTKEGVLTRQCECGAVIDIDKKFCDICLEKNRVAKRSENAVGHHAELAV